MLTPVFFGSCSKHPWFQVSSGLRATVVILLWDIIMTGKWIMSYSQAYLLVNYKNNSINLTFTNSHTNTKRQSIDSTHYILNQTGCTAAYKPGTRQWTPTQTHQQLTHLNPPANTISFGSANTPQWILQPFPNTHRHQVVLQTPKMFTHFHQARQYLLKQ